MQTADSFAVALRTARHAAGLTLEELSDASGVSVRALSDMERGRALGPQRRTVVAIADTLKLEGTRRSELVGLAKAGRTRSAYSAAAPGLCELPGSIGDFTGREAELAWIHRLHDLQDAGPAGVAVISGGAGLGKTTLVVRAAHRLRPRFPDGVYFVAAQGMSERPVGGDEILTRVLRALGVRDQQIPQDLAERAGRYRQLLRERRVLVVIDDVHSEAQVRPALPGGGNSLLLVTSRRLLAGLEGVRRLHLDPMPASDASDLLRRILAERPDPTREHDLQGLVDLLSGLPLALRIAGNRLVSRPGWSPAELIARLSAAERRLDQLTAGDLKVAAAFDMSYEQLPDVARQLFRRAALVPGTDFSTSLVSVAGALTVAEAEEHLDDLVDLSLVECVHGDRYRLHDLVRLYAHGRLDAEESAEAVTAARRQMVAWLLDTATSAGRMFARTADRPSPGSARPRRPKPGCASRRSTGFRRSAPRRSMAITTRSSAPPAPCTGTASTGCTGRAGSKCSHWVSTRPVRSATPVGRRSSSTTSPGRMRCRGARTGRPRCLSRSRRSNWPVRSATLGGRRGRCSTSPAPSVAWATCPPRRLLCVMPPICSVGTAMRTTSAPCW